MNPKGNPVPVDDPITASNSNPYESAPNWGFPDDEDPEGDDDGGGDGGLQKDIADMQNLQKEKQDLENRLQDARSALDDYTGRLGEQVSFIIR